MPHINLVLPPCSWHRSTRICKHPVAHPTPERKGFLSVSLSLLASRQPPPPPRAPRRLHPLHSRAAAFVGTTGLPGHDDGIYTKDCYCRLGCEAKRLLLGHKVV
jgi:hypothetical protein